MIDKFLGFADGDCFLDQLKPKKDHFWYYLKRAHILGNKDRRFLLVFDQFEEVFTYPRFQLNRFKSQLADILHDVVPKSIRDAVEMKLAEDDKAFSDEELRIIYEPLNLKVIIAIRSDKMSFLDQFKDVMPEILSKTYELEPLTREQTEDAILNPAYQKGEFASARFDFSDEALDAILNFLTQDGEQRVESFQLQVICQYAESLVIKHKKEVIERSDLGEINQIFENYYENLINQLPPEERLQARVFIEDGLVLEDDGIRLSLHEGQILRDFDISQALLSRLVDTRLIRAEPSARGGAIYELSHDTLIDPIIKAKKKRLEQEEWARREAERKEEILRRQSEQRAARRKLNVAIGIAVLIGLLGVGAVYTAFWANSEREKAERATTAAKAAQAEVESQKAISDSLLLVINNIIQKSKAETTDKDLESKLDTVAQEVQKALENSGTQARMGKLVSGMFHPGASEEDKEIRQKAYLAVKRDYHFDEKLIPFLIRYNREHFEFNEGIWNSLYVLENMDEETLLKQKEIVSNFLNDVSQKGYGPSTMARIERIKDKLN